MMFPFVLLMGCHAQYRILERCDDPGWRKYPATKKPRSQPRRSGVSPHRKRSQKESAIFVSRRRAVLSGFCQRHASYWNQQLTSQIESSRSLVSALRSFNRV